jgi:hypothetical protein
MEVTYFNQEKIVMPKRKQIHSLQGIELETMLMPTNAIQVAQLLLGLNPQAFKKKALLQASIILPALKTILHHYCQPIPIIKGHAMIITLEQDLSNLLGIIRKAVSLLADNTKRRLLTHITKSSTQ